MEGASTVTRPVPEEYEVDAAVITAFPGLFVLNVPVMKKLPAGIVS